jgi:hypothetical protein
MRQIPIVKTYEYGIHTFKFFDEDYVEVWFPDGNWTKTYIEPCAEQETRAQELGFESISHMNRWHDFIHVFLATKMGAFTSPTVWAMAHNTPLEAFMNGYEEELNFAFAAYVNLGKKDRRLNDFSEEELRDTVAEFKVIMQEVDGVFNEFNTEHGR